MSKKEEFKKALVEVRDAIDNLIVVLDATSDEEIEHLEDLPTTIEIIQEPAKEEAKAEEPVEEPKEEELAEEPKEEAEVVEVKLEEEPAIEEPVKEEPAIEAVKAEEPKAEEPKHENIQETSFDKFGNVVFKPSIRI